MATCLVVNLSPACVDITGVRAGDRNQVSMTISSKGTPLDLTNYEVTSQVRKVPTDSAPALTAIVEIADAINGKINVRWPGDDVSELLAGSKGWTGVWDLQIDDSASDPLTIVAGKFTAEMDVTR